VRLHCNQTLERDKTHVHISTAILEKFWHTISGLYIWEFVTNLGYELDILRGRRPYRWTIWIYSFTRVATLVAVVLNFVALDTTTPLNCQVWISFELIFSYLGVAAASLLITFRIFAIWNKDRVVVTISAILWAVSVAVIIRGIALTRSAWVPDVQTCVPLNTESNKLNITVTLIADFILLLIVLVGLLRLRRHGAGKSRIGLLLWNQGVIWLLIATVAEVPPTIFLCLNLNGPLNLMFQFPATITLSIAATRMYRSLTDFISGSTDIKSSESLPIHHNRASNAKPNSSASMSHSHIEVAVNTACDQFPMSDESLRSMDGSGQLISEKPHGLGPENDLESAAPWRPGNGAVFIERD